ncbi:MAG: sulfite exporter TauE/SafE family protein [Candidatus Endonucleobacter sp. (ex Gigantidas childressi)]|nr:sulfite exporter TauE/SafE family protein [Candidatus Endonucleobacter sp. (ex Gigantidas childressi)]
MTEITLFISALTLGLLGSAHCIGMCGGITSALSMSIAGRTQPAMFGLMLCYHLGRISSYALAGFILGSLGWFLGDSSTFLQVLLRILAGLMLISMGLYISGIWKGLTRLEVIGSVLWRKLQPIGKHLLPVKTVAGALALGSLWGWLPCGLVYSTLVWSSSQGQPLQSALLMFCFGVGTIPSVLLTGLLSKQLNHLIQAQLTRNIAAIMMILFGLWTFPGPHQKTIMALISF